MDMNKRGVQYELGLFLIIIGILFVSNILAETPEEEKARLEQELADLEAEIKIFA